MMKRYRILTPLLAAILSVSLSLPVFAAHYEAFEHPDVAFEDMAFTGIDLDAVEAFCERFTHDPAGEYDALLALYDEIYTQNELAAIRMFQNVDDDARSEAYEQSVNDFGYASDLLWLALSEALDGPQGDALRARMPEGAAESFYGYGAADDAVWDSYAAETALLRQYYSLPYDEGFEDAAAELYLRLVALRRQQAEDEGFDSYADYAYYVRFAREYDPADARRLCRIVKSRIAPLYVRCVQALAQRYMPWDDEDAPSDTEVLDALRAHLGDVSPELNEAFDYLLRNRLYCIGDGDALYNTGVTSSLPAYRSAFLFNKVSTRFGAFSSTVHEFGHFNAAYHDPTPMLYQYANTDVSEIQSQALELLFIPCLQDILSDGSERGRAYVALHALSEMLGGVVDGCLYDEFEQAVFADPAMTADGLFELERQLWREYGLDAIYDDEAYWCYVPHLFESPFYYISYAASALPAIDIWLLSQNDRDAAVDAYLNVSAARTEAWFLDVLYDNALCDVTDGREVERLADRLEQALAPMLERRSRVTPVVVIGLTAAVLGAGAIVLLRRRNGRRDAGEGYGV